MNNIKMPIQIDAKGVEFDEKERLIIDKLFKEYEEKIKRIIQNEFYLRVHIKVREKSKERKRYVIEVDLEGAVKLGSSVDDYDLAKAIHRVMNKILNEIEHKLHVSDHRNKKL